MASRHRLRIIAAVVLLRRSPYGISTGVVTGSDPATGQLRGGADRGRARALVAW